MTSPTPSLAMTTQEHALLRAHSRGPVSATTGVRAPVGGAGGLLSARDFSGQGRAAALGGEGHWAPSSEAMAVRTVAHRTGRCRTRSGAAIHVESGGRAWGARYALIGHRPPPHPPPQEKEEERTGMQEHDTEHSEKKSNSRHSGAELFTPRHGRAFPRVLRPHLPGPSLLRLHVAVHAVLVALHVRLTGRGAA